jgi:hypothetical protein
MGVEHRRASLSRTDLALALTTLLLLVSHFLSLFALVPLFLSAAWSLRTKLAAVGVWLGPWALIWFLLLNPTIQLPQPAMAFSPYPLIFLALRELSWLAAVIILAWALVRGIPTPTEAVPANDGSA